jgi:hypothetical protein
VTSGEIDISRGEWIAHHGEQSVDLVGLGVMGEVGQIVPTEPGVSYQLSFHYGNNPGPVPASAAVRVSENGGGLIKELVVTHSGSELSNMKWPRATVEFVANSSSTRISFTALSKLGDGGICIDSVELTKSEGVPDTDSDGVNDFREGKDGTDPNDPNSFNPLSKGLVAYYPFDGDADDESGNGYHGTVFGALLDQGIGGNANSSFRFAGETNWIKAPLGAAIFSSDYTLSIWAKIDDFENGTGGQMSLLSGNLGVINLSVVGSQYESTSPDARRITFYMYEPNPWTQVPFGGVASAEQLDSGKWRHVIIRKSGAAFSLFLDGVLSSSADDGTALELQDTFVEIGNAFRDPSSTSFYHGSLDNFRVYQRAISPTEVGQLYQTEAGILDSDGDGLTDAWERGYGRYQIVDGNFTWNQAKADAESKGGHLATITSQAEWDIIWTTCGANWAGKYYWLGASDRLIAGDWRWVTDEAWSYNRWCPGEPSGGPEDELISWVDLPDGQPGWNDGIGDSLPGNFGGYLLEFGYPTDPFKADTDGDGYDDKVETDAKTDPNNPASFPVPPDADNDGIPDASETNTGVYVSPTDTGTDPNNADTDGDGLSDGVETGTGTYVSATNTGTDPNIPDSDGDGLSDSVETNTGVYVSATNTGTNPLNEDTSGDGITDGEAVAAQFNPLIDQRPVLNFLTQAVAAQPNRFGFYNESNVMHLGMGGLMIRKAGSVVNLDLQWQTKNSLTNSWTNHGAPLPFFLNLPGSKAFIRLQATPGAP